MGEAFNKLSRDYKWNSFVWILHSNKARLLFILLVGISIFIMYQLANTHSTACMKEPTKYIAEGITSISLLLIAYRFVLKHATIPFTKPKSVFTGIHSIARQDKAYTEKILQDDIIGTLRPIQVDDDIKVDQTQSSQTKPLDEDDTYIEPKFSFMDTEKDSESQKNVSKSEDRRGRSVTIKFDDFDYL